MIKGEEMDKISGHVFLFIFCALVLFGCSNPSSVRKLTKPVDQTAEELVKIREIKSDGKTRAVVSPADEKQFKIPF